MFIYTFFSLVLLEYDRNSKRCLTDYVIQNSNTENTAMITGSGRDCCNIVGYSQADVDSASTAWGFNLISYSRCCVLEIKD